MPVRDKERKPSRAGLTGPPLSQKTTSVTEWTALPVHPVTVTVSLQAGHIDGESRQRAYRPLRPVDWVAALELGYRFATANACHSQMVPGLETVRF